MLGDPVHGAVAAAIDQQNFVRASAGVLEDALECRADQFKRVIANDQDAYVDFARSRWFGGSGHQSGRLQIDKLAEEISLSSRYRSSKHQPFFPDSALAGSGETGGLPQLNLRISRFGVSSGSVVNTAASGLLISSWGHFQW